MRRTRGYIEGELTSGTELVLPEDLAQHLTRVLRMRVGDSFSVFNGLGCEFAARLLSLDRKRTLAQIGEPLPATPESPLRLQLAQAVCRGEKMDLVLQKATELGVHSIQPLITERTEVRLDAEREARRLTHWRQVVISACEQSGRATVPQISALQSLPDWLSQRASSVAEGNAGLALALDPEGSATLAAVPKSEAMTIAIGPEGGFAANESQLMHRHHFLSLRLGPRTLRTETAGLAAIAALQTLHGDF